MRTLFHKVMVASAILFSVGPDSTSASSSRPLPLHPSAISHPSFISTHHFPHPPSSHSHSNQPPPGVHPSTPPAHDSHFLLSFVSHSLPFTLSLKPSPNLIHPNGIKLTTTHLDPITGERTETTEWIQRSQVRAYEGSVWLHSESENGRENELFEKWVKEEQVGVRRDHSLNWARIVLPDSPSSFEANNPFSPTTDGDDLLFQGSFSIQGETYSIHSTPHYLSSKHPLDPPPPLLLSLSGNSDYSNLVIIKDHHVLTPAEQVEELKKRGVAVPAPEELLTRRSFGEEGSVCGHDHLDFNLDPQHPVYLGSSLPSQPFLTSTTLSTSSFLPFSRELIRKLSKRQSGGGDVAGASNASSNFINSIGSTVGCPKSSMVLFVGVAADCTFTQQYSSSDVARTQILTDFNSVSSLYQSSFNISIGIVELLVQSGSCPTSSSTVDPSNPWNVGCPEGGSPGLDLNDRLSVFSQWRGSKGANDGAGLWHLLTNCSTGSEVGVAWLGQLCKVTASGSGTATGNGSASVTSGTGVTALTRSTWQVIAHEIGHSFGAIHDCADGCTLENSNPICCPLSTSTCNANANFIMSPVSTKNVSSFSPCSIGNICTSLSSSLNTTCLAKPGVVGNPDVISLKSCGNGILEAGEDCDPGSNTNDPCCDAATCKFATGAVCDPLNSLCCTTSCQIASSGTVCRASVDLACDYAETCDGNNSTCPADTFKKDGSSCGNGLACASGICTSRSLQCQEAGASLNLTTSCPTKASDSCSISCQDPSSSSDCIVLEQSFRDGSPCGYAGTCENSVCKAGSALDVAKSWYRQNLQIAVPVTVVAAVIILLFILGITRCCLHRCRRQKSAKLAPSAQFSGMPPMVATGRNGAKVSRRRDRGNEELLRPPPGGSGSEEASLDTSGSGLNYSGEDVQRPQRGYNVGREYYQGGNNGGGYYPNNGSGPWMPGVGPNTNQGQGGWVDPAAYNGRHQPR